jgi:hypothetical protein
LSLTGVAGRQSRRPPKPPAAKAASSGWREVAGTAPKFVKRFA